LQRPREGRRAASPPILPTPHAHAPAPAAAAPPPWQGLKKSYDYKKVLKALKKEFCCNGTVVDDAELGQARSTRARAWGRRAFGSGCAQRDRGARATLGLLKPLAPPPQKVIQLQGDQRKNVLQFLTQEGLVKKDLIKVHGERPETQRRLGQGSAGPS
jgi:translation initiation factor 1 (eIF-1/SUI1)